MVTVNMDGPKISVIIPNYNHRLYLEERIESVIAQTYQNFEIILLDDSSTDGSSIVLNRYKDHPKVSQLLISAQNSGTAFRQWAKGIELAKGDWVWIAESDDWCEPTLLQTLVDGIDENTAYSFCQSLMIEDNAVIWSLKADYLSKKYTGYDFIKNFMLKESKMYNASMCIFKRELYFKISKNFTTYTFCGDWLFWILLAQYGDIYVSGKVLNYFRKHKDDVSGGATKKGVLYKEYIRLLDDLIQNSIITRQEQLNLLKYKLNELLLNNKLATTVRYTLVPLYYEALKGELINQHSFRIFGRRLFAQICLDAMLGKI